MPRHTVDFYKRAAVFVLIALVPVLVWLLFDVLLIGMGAILIAVLLEVGAEPFGWIRLPRWIALILSAMVIICVVGGAVYLFGTGVVSELQEVLDRIEEARKTIIAALESSDMGKMLLLHVQNANIPVTGFIGRIFGGGISFLAVLW
jgi:predicted PurR-regulated permease PerM